MNEQEGAKVVQLENKLSKVNAKITIFRRAQKSRQQKEKRVQARELSLSTSVANREAYLLRTLGKLQDESLKREEDFETMRLHLEAMTEDLKEAKALIVKLEELVANPEPAVNFGSKGEPWSFEVFELCVTMLIERPTAANMLEGILTKPFPKRKVRCPSAKAFEVFRMTMYPFPRFRILYCMSKAKRWHGIGDESRKGGASMFLTGMKGEEFETSDGLESHNALLDVKFVLNQVRSGCGVGCVGGGSVLFNVFIFILFYLVCSMFLIFLLM